MFLEVFVELTVVFLLLVILPLIDWDDESLTHVFHEYGHSNL